MDRRTRVRGPGRGKTTAVADQTRVASTIGALALVAGCVSTPPQKPVWVNPRTEVETFDSAGRPTDGTVLPPASPWRLQPVDEEAARALDPVQDPEAQDPAQDPDAEAQRRHREAMIRATFGDAVTFNSDGSVTKLYPVTINAGKVFLSLARPWDAGDQRKLDVADGGTAQFGGEKTGSVLDRMLGADHTIDVVYMPDFIGAPNMSVPAKPKDVARPEGQPVVGALIIVTSKPSSLAAFERAVDLFYTNIPQIEIEVKVVEYATTDTLNFGIDPPGAADDPQPSLTNLSSGKLIDTITADFPITAPFVGTSSVSDVGLIQLGGIHDSWELDATLQALETNAKVDIVSQPKLVVMNGGRATVRTVTSVPFPQARISTAGNVIESGISFKETGIQLTIQPEVAGTDTITLLVHANIAAITSFAGTEPIPTPIISSREASTSVHLREGEAMVVGGLVTNQVIESESKIPLLGDIPILGYLFRNTSTQNSKTTLQFHITPTIVRSSGG